MIADSVSMGLLAALGFGLAEFASALLARRTSHFRLIFGVNVASVLAATAYAPFDGGIRPRILPAVAHRRRTRRPI